MWFKYLFDSMTVQRSTLDQYTHLREARSDLIRDPEGEKERKAISLEEGAGQDVRGKSERGFTFSERRGVTDSDGLTTTSTRALENLPP